VIANANCLEALKYLPAGSVDMVLGDLPYGTTQAHWDTPIDLARFWPEVWRVCKPNAAVVLFTQVPFNIILGASQLRYLRYEWIWQKSNKTGFLNAKKMPLKEHENIQVFYRKLPTYTPQMIPITPVSGGTSGRVSENYRPGLSRIARRVANDRYPTSILCKKSAINTIHSTQKPIDLCEYLIQTYTNPGETVLDPTMGSGTTGVACLRTGRRFIGYELDPDIYKTAVGRITDTLESL
jgi:site-specific DNA-methyltransferase (adenine-specific)